MARIKGVTSFAANFESEKAAPLIDMYCQTVADMLSSTEQQAHDGAAYMYYGRRAIVFDDPNSDNNGTYQLIDPANPTLATSWGKFGSSDDNGGTETVDQTFYISTTGDDSTGDGTLATPYATIVPIKARLKKNIKCAINIIYLAGHYTIDTETFKFPGFRIDDSSWDYYIWIMGDDLNTVDTVTLTNLNEWEHQDTSKAWTTNEHVGRFLAIDNNVLNYVKTIPIAENNGDTLKAAYGSFVSEAYDKIVENTTTLEVLPGDPIVFDTQTLGRSGVVYVTNMNILTGSDRGAAGNSGALVFLRGVYLRNESTVTAFDINGGFRIGYSFVELHSRMYAASGEYLMDNSSSLSYATCYHLLRPSTPSENTDAWFNHTLMNIPDVRPYAYNSFMYWKSVYNPGYYATGSNMTLEGMDSTFFGHCGVAFAFREPANVVFKGTKLTLDDTCYLVANRNNINGAVFDAKNVSLIGTPTKALVAQGTTTWDFVYDGVAHSINAMTSGFSNNVLVDIARRQMITLPGYYPEINKVELVKIDDTTDEDITIGNLKNRSITIEMDIDGGTEYAHSKIELINVDDLSSSLANNVVLESQESGSLLNVNLSGATAGLYITFSIGSGEIIMNIDNTSTLDVNVRYVVKRTNKL